MNTTTFILITLAMAAATFVIRFSVIGLAGKFEMSERFKKTLRFVPYGFTCDYCCRDIRCRARYGI